MMKFILNDSAISLSMYKSKESVKKVHLDGILDHQAPESNRSKDNVMWIVRYQRNCALDLLKMEEVVSFGIWTYKKWKNGSLHFFFSR